jgi:hypothetical protein
MPVSPTLPLLQPLTASTPLAALFNRWLLALAPVELLTRTGRPSAARDYLALVTNSLHCHHRTVAEVAKMLRKGKPLSDFERYCTAQPGKSSLCIPIPQLFTALALAALGPTLETTTRLRGVMNCRQNYLRQTVANIPEFLATAAHIQRTAEVSKNLGFGLLGRNDLRPDKLIQVVDYLLNACQGSLNI